MKETKPDLVTMDMTLPGTDGLACTRAIHEINENIKVIVVSSMMDEEIEKEAKKNKFSGRMLIDLSQETANNLAAALLRKEPKNSDQMMAAIGEFTNIILGNACSILNRKNKALGLRVAPPSILSGDSVLISAPNFNTTMAIAFEG